MMTDLSQHIQETTLMDTHEHLRKEADYTEHGPDVLQDLFGGGRVGNFQAKVFVQADHELESIHRIEAHAAGTEKRLIVCDFIGSNLQHQALDHQSFYLLLQSVCVLHGKIMGAFSVGALRLKNTAIYFQH